MIFKNMLTCKFGLLTVFATWLSTQMIGCTAPSNIPSFLDLLQSKVVGVRVTSNGVDYSNEIMQLTYYTPSVNSGVLISEKNSII
jgi:hypothetical protein